MADETLKKLAEQFMNAGKSEEQRRRDRNASFIEDLLRTVAGTPLDVARPSVRQPEPEKPATRLIGCRGCGQVNRVSSVVVAGKKPVCGKCKAEL